MSKLVIVESPAKARTIEKYLGREYTVRSSFGHVRDLPVKAEPVKRGAAAKKRTLLQRIGVDPEHGWEANYQLVPGREKIIHTLQALAKKAECVYLATDLDREGEAIAWHLSELLGPGGKSAAKDFYRRVVFSEITRTSIKKAFEEPGALDMNRVNAQQARRFLDRVVGFMLSPLLRSKVAGNLSAGRVQSVAVRLIVEREREIRAFVPEEFWEVFAQLESASGEVFRAQVQKWKGKKFRPGSEAQTKEALEALREAQYQVAECVSKPTRTSPGPPFITSTLQQAASGRFGYGLRRIMQLAQSLYEAGYISYMRTDSTSVSGIAVAACREFIGAKYGKRYVPAAVRFYANKASAQEAHEAIRPTDVNRTPGSLGGVSEQAMRLYELIWKRFVASQMPDAEFLATTVTVEAGEFLLRAQGRVMRFDGFMKVLPPAEKNALPVLPELAAGDQLQCKKLEDSQHFTTPPRRYSEASLVKELEKRGIGRPSTYAAIIATIQERGYVEVRKRSFYALRIGNIVTARLVRHFADLMDYNFTANMEQSLDEVASARRVWKELLDEFYADFHGKLEKAQDAEHGMQPSRFPEVDIPCPQCGRKMGIRISRTGMFLGCSGYGEKGEAQCRVTMNLEEPEPPEEGAPPVAPKFCELCEAPLVRYLVNENLCLYVCDNTPDCPGHRVEKGQFAVAAKQGATIECDKCGGVMQLRSGRFGKYFSCDNAQCKNTRKQLPSGLPAPPKMTPIPAPELRCAKVDDHYVIRDGAAGLFLAASGFPKKRETRSPLLQELLPHRDQLDQKYLFLLEGPTEDDQGNPTVVCSVRKTGEQYLRAEKSGKPTGWTAHYRDGKWQSKQSKPQRKKTLRKKLA